MDLKQPIEVHIDRLVLRGVDRGVAADLGPAIEAELGRLIAHGGLPQALAAGGAVAQVDGGSFRSSQADSAAPMARQIASAIYGGGPGQGEGR